MGLRYPDVEDPTFQPTLDTLKDAMLGAILMKRHTPEFWKFSKSNVTGHFILWTYCIRCNAGAGIDLNEVRALRGADVEHSQIFAVDIECPNVTK